MNNQLIKPKSFKDLVQSEPIKNRMKEIMGERGQQFAVALTQIVNGSYQLQKCEPQSILGAALTAASLDLSCDPNLGEAHLVPYGDKCQFQIGYKGFIQLAMRSGQYKQIGSAPIYKGELISYDKLTGEIVIDSDKRDPDEEVIGYAAKFKLINGFERAEYWTKAQVEAHALRYSKAYKYAKGDPSKERNCLWVSDFDKMALKTVEKALLSHYGPKSIQMQKAIKVDGAAVVDVETEQVEYLDNPDAPKIVKPEFDEPKTVEVASEVATEKPKQAEPEPTKTTPPPAKKVDSPSMNKRKAIKLACDKAGVTVEQLLAEVGSMGLDVGKALDDTDDGVVEAIFNDMSIVQHTANKNKK